MKLLWAVVVAVILAGCKPGSFSGAPAPEWSRTIDDNGWWRRVVNRQQLPVSQLPAGFRRPTDPVAGLINLLVADDQTVCVVDDQALSMARTGDNFRCVWRRWR